jgi:hypothetical protein
MNAASWRGAAQFGLWTVVGAGLVLSLLTVLTIGIFVLPVTAALAGLLAWRGNWRLAGPGALTGFGLVPIYIGYLNRGGPGMVCITTGTSGSCTQEMSPWPWLVVGLCFVVAGAVLCRRTLRRTTAGTRPGR